MYLLHRASVTGEGNGTPLQYSCLENPMDRGAWEVAVHGVTESRTRLSNFTFTFHFHALEKEMATHCSVLAWRIPGIGEPGGLPFMGSHRVWNDWSDLAAAAATVTKDYKLDGLQPQKCIIVFEVTRSCPTLWDPKDCSLPGSNVHGIFQARILEWVATSFSRRSCRPRDWTLVSCIVGRHFTVWATRGSPQGYVLRSPVDAWNCG